MFIYISLTREFGTVEPAVRKEGDVMLTARKRIMLTSLSILLLTGICLSTGCSSSDSGSASSTATILSNETLRGSRQGHTGIALDLNGDGRQDLLVGAPFADLDDTQGAVLVYLANPQGAFFNSASAVLRGAGNLGWSLVALGDVDGDGKDDFAAGAYSGSGERSSLSGTVVVYKGGSDPQQLVVLEGENAMDKFGYALASGDLNHDGATDLIVGAPFHSPSPALYQSGAVYVFFGPDYTQANVMKIPATDSNGGIGFSLAVGDINGDQTDDLLMGASYKVIGFYGGTNFSSVTAPDVAFGSRDSGFGLSMAVLWDLNRDGYNELAVGAYKAAMDADDIDTGRLYILGGGNASLDLMATIDGNEQCGQFAAAILPVDDLDDDGIPELAVSTIHGDAAPWGMTGKIFFFIGSSLLEGATVQTAKVLSGNARDMHLGTFLASVRGGKWIAAGAPTDSGNVGSVRLYELAWADNK